MPRTRKRVLFGDIWDHRRTRDWVVIPTNIGWKQDRTAVMGRGLAKQAHRLCAPLPAWYGRLCAEHGAEIPTLAHPDWRFILFPTKPMNAKQPWMSWRGPSTLERIEQSCEELLTLIPQLRRGRVLMPLVGCGNGGLAPEDILPHLWALGDREARITLVVRHADVEGVTCPECAGMGEAHDDTISPPAYTIVPCTVCSGSGVLSTGKPPFREDDPLGIGVRQ